MAELLCWITLDGAGVPNKVTSDCIAQLLSLIYADFVRKHNHRIMIVSLVVCLTPDSMLSVMECCCFPAEKRSKKKIFKLSIKTATNKCWFGCKLFSHKIHCILNKRQFPRWKHLVWVKIVQFPAHTVQFFPHLPILVNTVHYTAKHIQ